MSPFWGPLAVLAASAIAHPLLTLLSNLLEQAGPIRLRSWSEDAGARLRGLYRQRRRFDAFRFIVRVLARLSGLTVLLALVALGSVLSWDEPFRLAFLIAALWILLTEWLSRHLVGGDPEQMLSRSVAGYRALDWLLSPLLPLVSALLPVPRTADDEDSDEASPGEIDAFIDVGRREGILEPDEGELLRGLVDFGDAQVRSVMTPRIDLVSAPVGGTTDELIDSVLESGHSRIPIFRESIDDVVGILHVRDLLRMVREGDAIDEYLQSPHFVPVTKSLTELLRELQERHQELAVVVDEYGGIEGVVTIEDLLEEIFGEIVDEHDEEEPPVVALANGGWRVDGRLTVAELFELVKIDPPDVSYETVGGLIFDILERVPVAGDEVTAFGLVLGVETADLRSARSVRVARFEEDEDGDSRKEETSMTPGQES